MATWNKLIFSGSDAQVSSMDISTPSANPTNSLVIEDGQVDFGYALPGMGGTLTLEEGRVMKGDLDALYGGSGLNLWVKNGTSVFTGEDLIIPSNGQPADITNAGTVGVAALLALLTELGTIGDPDDLAADLNGDGTVAVGDLLILLAAFGADTVFNYGSDDDDDSRPYINWGLAQYNYIEVVDDPDEDDITHTWVVDGLVTKESVTALYNTIKQVEGEDYFWDTFLPHGSTVSTNVSDYMTQMEGLSDPNFEVFIYIYFTQTGSAPADTINVNGTPKSIGGGSDIFNRAGVSLYYWTILGEATSPLGYDV